MKGEDLESQLDLPTDEDENVGEGAPKKKVKKRKSKEERVKDRKVVFWTFLVVMLVTIFFWIFPKIRSFDLSIPTFNREKDSSQEKKPTEKEWKNYVEYKL